MRETARYICPEAAKERHGCGAGERASSSRMEAKRWKQMRMVSRAAESEAKDEDLCRVVYKPSVSDDRPHGLWSTHEDLVVYLLEACQALLRVVLGRLSFLSSCTSTTDQPRPLERKSACGRGYWRHCELTKSMAASNACLRCDLFEGEARRGVAARHFQSWGASRSQASQPRKLARFAVQHHFCYTGH